MTSVFGKGELRGQKLVKIADGYVVLKKWRHGVGRCQILKKIANIVYGLSLIYNYFWLRKQENSIKRLEKKES